MAAVYVVNIVGCSLVAQCRCLTSFWNRQSHDAHRHCRQGRTVILWHPDKACTWQWNSLCKWKGCGLRYSVFKFRL